MSDLTDRVRDALKQVFDPEAGVNIVDLGLIYDISEEADGAVVIEMTFTTESCPAGPYLQEAAEAAVRGLPDIDDVRIELTFDPPWTPERITPDGRAWLLT